MAVFHLTGTLFVSILRFMIYAIIGATVSIHIFKNLTGISSSPVAFESEIAINSLVTDAAIVCSSSSRGMFGRGLKFSSRLDAGMFCANSLPMFEKKLFNSVMISSGSVLSLIQVILLFGLLFCRSLFSAFHSFAESLPAS